MSDEVYIRVNENNRVTFFHYSPLDPDTGMGRKREDLEQAGIFLPKENVPSVTNKEGFRSVPYYNPDTNSIYYKYTAITLSDTERLDLLESAFNDLILGGKL